MTVSSFHPMWCLVGTTRASQANAVPIYPQDGPASFNSRFMDGEALSRGVIEVLERTNDGETANLLPDLGDLRRRA
jgi:hypothetical protein